MRSGAYSGLARTTVPAETDTTIPVEIDTVIPLRTEILTGARLDYVILFWGD